MGLFDFFKKKKVVKKTSIKRKKRKSQKDKQIQEAFIKIKSEQQNQNQNIEKLFEITNEHSEILNILKPLPNQFKELQKQFTEFIVSSVNSPTTSLSVHQKPNEPSELTELNELTLDNLTPHTKQAFGIILRLLNEYGEEWLPISDLTRELYPEKEAKKIRNAVSNTLKPLLTNKLIERKREGNFVFIKLTEKGFKISQTELSKIQLKKLAKYYKK